MELIECVPNFSEGMNFATIDQLIYSVKRPGLTVLHVDTGADAQRTVVTLVGNKSALLNGLFEMIKNAAELIDLNKHKGVHPYIGAVDVVPFIPLKNCTMTDCNNLASELAQLVGSKLNIPCFLYARSATDPARVHLSFLRRGNFPGLKDRMCKDPLMKPDYGPLMPHPTAGAIAIGARPLMVAFNISLNTTSAKAAAMIAELIRETGVSTKKHPNQHKALRLKSVKAIGWFVAEYNCAQVSTNIMDFAASPISTVFEAVKRFAKDMGIKVIGSQLVGLIPYDAILAAGSFYTNSQHATEQELLNLAVKELGLAKHQEFILAERVLEFKLKQLEIA